MTALYSEDIYEVIWENKYSGRNVESPVIHLPKELVLAVPLTIEFSFTGHPHGGLEVIQGDGRDTMPMISIYELGNP